MEGKRNAPEDFLQILFRRKWVIILTFLAIVVPVSVVSFIMAPVYEATSKLLVKFGMENIYTPATEPDWPHLISTYRDSQINSEIEILKSPSLIKQAVGHVGITKLFPDIGDKENLEVAAAQALKKLDAERLEKTDVIETRFRHEDRQVASDFLNILVKLYREQRLRLYKDPKEYGFFKNQANVLGEKLQGSEQALENFKEKNSITTLQEQKSLVLAKYTDIQAQARKTETDIQEARGKIYKLKGQLDLPTKSSHVAISENLPPVVNSLKQTLAALELERAKLLERYKPDNCEVVVLNKKIDKTKEMLAHEWKELQGHGSMTTGLGGVSPVYQTLETQLLLEETNLKALEARQAGQKRQLAAYSEELNTLNKLERELRRLERQVEIDEKNYKLYVTKAEENRLTEAMDKENMVSVSVIQWASPPLGPVAPRRLLNILLSVCIGGMVAWGLTFLVEYFDNSLRTEGDVERHLGLPTLVSFPRYAEGSDPTHINPAPLPGLIDTYQKLKTNMLVMNGGELKAVVVSSPESKNGSTWITSGFAVTMARYNSHKVVLIDANLRDQGIYQRFDIPNGHGLAEVIQEKADLDDVLKKSKLPNLSIITAGEDYTDPALIFESQRWKDLINELKKRFDWVIIDSSPINSYPDTTLMAPHVDGLIFLVQAEKTQIDAALQAKEWLERAKVKIIGAVINKKRYVWGMNNHL